MALRGIYSVSTGSNVDISARLRANSLDVTSNAEQGSVALSTLAVDDPEGGINIVGLKNITLTETAESSNSQTIYTGWTADREVNRGQSSFRTQAARLWTVKMADQNSLITRRIMRGSDANRPAETDVDRVQWLLTTDEFGSVVTNSRYVSTLYPVAMDAVDYRDQSNQQILDDCSQASGKNYFVMYDEPVASYGLFYDFPGSSAYRSTIRLSNVLSDVDSSVTFAVSEADTKLARDPSRVYSGVVLPYVGGEVYVQSSAIATSFVARDTTAPSVNVKTSAKATARANRYLGDAASEADVVTTSFKAPLASVNHIMAGMAVSCRFSHLPGYGTSFTWMRVLNREVVATSEEFYTVTVEMASAVGGLSADGQPPAPWACIPTDFSVPLCSGPAGDPIAGPVGAGNTNTVSAESVRLYPGATYRFDYTIVHASSTGFDTRKSVFMVSGPYQFTVIPVGSTDPGLKAPPVYAVSQATTIAGGLAGEPRCWNVGIADAVYVGHDMTGSTVSVHVTYVSGSDSRFVGLPPCSNGSAP